MALYTASKTRRSLIDSVMFRMLSQIATVSSYVVLVRGMPKSDFGVFNLLYSFIPVFGTIASFGLEQILRRYQPDYLRQGNAPGAVTLVRLVASSRFLLNVLLIGVMLLAWNHIAPIFHMGPYREPFAAFAVLLILHFQSQILILSLASHMLHRFSVGAMTMLAFGKLIGYLVMRYAGGFSLIHAIIADTIAYGCIYVFLRIVYRRRCVPQDMKEPYRPPAAERRRMLKYGLYNNFNDAGVLLLGGAADNLFIAAFIDPISVGIYAFYGRLNEMAINLLPVRFFDNIVQPLFFSIDRAEAHRRVRQFFTFLIDINVILLWGLLTFAVVYHEELVRIVFAGKYVEYSWLLPLIMLFSTINSIAVPVSLTAQYEEKAGIILLSKIFVIYNIVSMLILLPRLGIYGAILSRGTAEAFKNLFIWWWVRDRARWDNARAVLTTGVLLWGSIGLICYEAKRLIPLPSIMHCAFGVLMCGLGLLIYLRTPAIGASDRQLLATVFVGKEGRLLQRLGLLRPSQPEASGA